MRDIQKIKQQTELILQGASSEYMVVDHNHVNDDIWSITIKNTITGKFYIFKSDGFEFYDFEEKKLDNAQNI